MPGMTQKIRAIEGGTFDCYLVVPETGEKVPAVVLASAVHGVDENIRGLADAFAAQGFIAAAPDLFWHSIPGPLPHDDERTKQRSQPRLEKLKAGEADMADTLAHVRTLPQFNGRAAAIGFCYGGPYAILGPKRLGYDAGISCHGTNMLDFLPEIEGITAPICVLWGDEDRRAPPDVVAAYRALTTRMPNVTMHIFPGVGHGYMLPTAHEFNRPARDASMTLALALLEGLREGKGSAMRRAS